MARVVFYTVGLAVFLAAGVLGVYLSQGSAPTSTSDRVPQQRISEARHALERNSYLDVVRIAREVSDEQLGAAEMRLWQGVALWKLDRWKAAEDAWWRALQIDPEVPEASWRLLLMFFYLQRFAEAEELALKLYPIEPDPNDRAKLLLEIIRQDIERIGPEATAISLEPVLVNEPGNIHAMRAVGLSYVQLGRVTDGAELIERAWRLRPEDPEVASALVWYLLETGQMQRLGELWTQLPGAANEQARLLRFRGMWAEAIGNDAEAERAYRAAIDMDAADRKAHYQLARLLRRAGEDEEAERHEKEAGELDDAREALAAAYLRATQSGLDLSSEDCHEFARLCERLARTRQAKRWEQEASRRVSGGLDKR